MDQLQTLTAASSSSSPSFDEGSLHQSLQLDHHAPSDKSMHDINVALGVGQVKPTLHPISSSTKHRANRWKFTIFGLVRFNCYDDYYVSSCSMSTHVAPY